MPNFSKLIRDQTPTLATILATTGSVYSQRSYDGNDLHKHSDSTSAPPTTTNAPPPPHSLDAKYIFIIIGVSLLAACLFCVGCYAYCRFSRRNSSERQHIALHH
jgi:hypothetical protein